MRERERSAPFARELPYGHGSSEGREALLRIERRFCNNNGNSLTGSFVRSEYINRSPPVNQKQLSSDHVNKGPIFC